MQIGFTLPQMGALANEAARAARFAAEAERLGADSLWVGDRMLAPVNPSVGYMGGDGIPEVFHSVLDPFALMSAAAAVTERVRIGSNVLNAPWYPPALLARSLTTIDQISGGRLIAGFGTGWSPEEYQAAGVPMPQRGARLDECLDVLFSWWSENPVEHHGEHWSVPASRVNVKSVQRPRPPVHLAAFSPAALRRVARRADGWLPVHVPGASEFDPAALNGTMAEIRRHAAEAGRDPAELGAVLRINPVSPENLDETVETIKRAQAETEIDHVFVELMNLAKDVDQALEFAEQVLRLARG